VEGRGGEGRQPGRQVGSTHVHLLSGGGEGAARNELAAIKTRQDALWFGPPRAGRRAACFSSGRRGNGFSADLLSAPRLSSHAHPIRPLCAALDESVSRTTPPGVPPPFPSWTGLARFGFRPRLLLSAVRFIPSGCRPRPPARSTHHPNSSGKHPLLG